MTAEIVKNTTFNEIKNNFEKDYGSIFENGSELTKEIESYLEQSKGKRIRPIVSLMFSKVIGNFDSNKFIVASLVEIIHNCSIIQDDVIDNSFLRRGSRTINDKYTNRVAIFFSVYLLTKFIERCIDNNREDIIKSIYPTIQLMINAEILQAKRGFLSTVSEKEYYDVINGKTAALFSISFEMCSYGENIETVMKARNLGYLVGMAFQVKDDIIDFLDGTGKSKFNDIKEGKLTLPLIHALSKERKTKQYYILFLIKIFPSKQFTQYLIQKVIDKHCGIEYAQTRVEEYTTEGIKILEGFKDSVYKDSMIAILKSIALRDK